MMDTVVAIFDDYNEAVQARQSLLGAGIKSESLEISPQPAGGKGATRDSQRDHRGFFARLFGLGRDDEETGHYAEAVRRGSTALTVSLDDASRVDEISDILKDAGAIDIDERVERWRAGGYTGFDESAPLYTDEEMQRERETFRTDESMARYRGPERRVRRSASYTGPERRMAP